MILVYYWFNTFFIYSILGYLFETTGNFIFDLTGNSGILNGPWTPIYGLGMIIAIVIHQKLDKKYHSKKVKNFLLFTYCIIILTILEQIGGMLIEYFLHTTYWDYTKLMFNFGKYISLETSLLWGILVFLVINFLKPFIDKINSKIPHYLTYILILLFLIDATYTWITK